MKKIVLLVAVLSIGILQPCHGYYKPPKQYVEDPLGPFEDGAWRWEYSWWRITSPDPVKKPEKRNPPPIPRAASLFHRIIERCHTTDYNC